MSISRSGAGGGQALVALVAFGALGLALAAAPASAEPRVRHVPPAAAEAGAALELVAAAPPAVPALVAHYRRAGGGPYAEIELVRRDDERWVAVVPAAAVAPPGVEYYLTAGGEPVFASAEAPQAARVAVSALVERRARDEARAGGRRSRVQARFDWVDDGARTERRPDTGEAVRVVDRYYRLDADFAYHLWAYPLEDLRVGFSRLLGDTAGEGVATTERAGFNVSGWFELGVAPVEGLALDARAIVLATRESVALGGRGELRVGVRDGTHLAAGGEYLADVGATGFVRFGWGTVPRAPMAVTVEVTDLPASARPTGVRLYYDVTAVLARGVRIGLRLGYAARRQNLPGFTGGTMASIDF